MLELECLSCGFKWDTDNEDEAVQGTCPICNEYIYNECGELDRFLFPLQSDYDYTCHCEDAPCCGCNSFQAMKQNDEEMQRYIIKARDLDFSDDLILNNLVALYYDDTYEFYARAEEMIYTSHVNSESGQIAVLYIAIVAILAYILVTFLMPFVTPVLATLDGLQ